MTKKYLLLTIIACQLASIISYAYLTRTEFWKNINIKGKVVNAVTSTIVAVKGYLKGLFNGSYAEGATD